MEVVAELEIVANEMPVAEILGNFPDFVLPTNIPEGYSLSPTGFYISDDHGFSIVWTHPTGENISLTRTKMLRPDIPEPEDGKVVEVVVSMETGYEVRGSGAKDDQYAVFTWVDEENTYHYMLTASDENINEAQLSLMFESP